MASRSTRNKVRWQVDKAIRDAEKIIEHLAYVDQLAGGKSPYIDKMLPTMVILADTHLEVLLKFRSGL